MQVELRNGSDLRYLELSPLGPEAILSYLDLGGERRGERGERGAWSVERRAESGATGTGSGPLACGEKSRFRPR